MQWFPSIWRGHSTGQNIATKNVCNGIYMVWVWAGVFAVGRMRKRNECGFDFCAPCLLLLDCFPFIRTSCWLGLYCLLAYWVLCSGVLCAAPGIFCFAFSFFFVFYVFVVQMRWHNAQQYCGKKFIGYLFQKLYQLFGNISCQINWLIWFYGRQILLLCYELFESDYYDNWI